MSLTVGTGPFGHHPAGRFNVEIEAPDGIAYFERIPHRIRAFRRGDLVVDSTNVHLLHESGKLPVFWFPEDDVREQKLARRRDDPLLAGFATIEWVDAEEWFCEDEQIFGHPRDPYSRIDVYRTTRHARVLRGGELLAESRRAKILFETGLPPRYYLPPDDVRTDLLVSSPSKTRCAYKGSASYFSVRLGDRLVEDLVWTYPDPQHDAEPVRDLLCFFNERVDLELDGEPQERPRTQWTRADDS